MKEGEERGECWQVCKCVTSQGVVLLLLDQAYVCDDEDDGVTERCGAISTGLTKTKRTKMQMTNKQ